MSKMKEWLLDRQLNGDDGTGHCDYEVSAICDECGEIHDEENEVMTIKEEGNK